MTRPWTLETPREVTAEARSTGSTAAGQVHLTPTEHSSARPLARNGPSSPRPLRVLGLLRSLQRLPPLCCQSQVGVTSRTWASVSSDTLSFLQLLLPLPTQVGAHPPFPSAWVVAAPVWFLGNDPCSPDLGLFINSHVQHSLFACTPDPNLGLIFPASLKPLKKSHTPGAPCGENTTQF